MIQGTNKIRNSTDYHKIVMDSASSLKDFSLDRKKYFRKWVMGEEIEEKETQALTTGSLVDCLLLESEQFDNKFYLSSCVSAPTGLTLAFIENLYVISKQATDENGVITRSFEDISKEAYELAGYKRDKYEKVIKDFSSSDAEIYYNEIRKVRANNLIVITTQDISNAERIVEELKTNPVTKDIVNLVNSKRWEVRNQFQVEGYEIDGHLFKSMMDKFTADHLERTLQIDDLKCVYCVETFYNDYYLFRRAYIQGYLYYRAVLSLSNNTESDYYGYTVLPPRFIVCDSINYYNPLIYKMTYEDLEDAYKGFEYLGRKYPGVASLIEDLVWSLDNNIWNISKTNYLNNGIRNIKS